MLILKKKKLLHDDIVLDIVLEVMTHTSDIKNTILVLIEFQSNPPKHPQSAANDVEGIEYCWFHHVSILISYDSS